MKKLILISTFILVTGIESIGAQEKIDLSGKWSFGVGTEAAYDDFVSLPGSMQTNGKGNEVTVHTVWTGSTYDSSYYFNPFMEKYRMEGNVKYPFFLTPDKHFVGTAWYKRTVRIPKAWYMALPRTSAYRDNSVCERKEGGTPDVAVNASRV